MASRRMVAKELIDSDYFLDMSSTAQLLYFHLMLRADDDGFVSSPKKIMRMIGASDDDISLLLLRKFIIKFESGVVVITHWKIHNYIQKDRYKETFYKKEKAALQENGGIYSFKQNVTILDTECIQDVSNSETQGRLGKGRLGKGRLGKVRREEEEEGESNNASCKKHEATPLPKTPYKEIINNYNLKANNLPRAMSLTDTRKKAMLTLWKKHPSIEWFQNLFDKANATTFLTGDNSRGWTANIDWLLKESNAIKVLEGLYDKNGKQQYVTKSEALAEYNRKSAEEALKYIEEKERMEAKNGK